MDVGIPSQSLQTFHEASHAELGSRFVEIESQ